MSALQKPFILRLYICSYLTIFSFKQISRVQDTSELTQVKKMNGQMAHLSQSRYSRGCLLLITYRPIV